MIDVQNKMYHAQHGMNCTSIIPTNIYGMHDNFSIGTVHMPTTNNPNPNPNPNSNPNPNPNPNPSR